MRVNPPTLFWMMIAAILAADRFLPLAGFNVPGLPWGGVALARAAAHRPVKSPPLQIFTSPKSPRNRGFP